MNVVDIVFEVPVYAIYVLLNSYDLSTSIDWIWRDRFVEFYFVDNRCPVCASSIKCYTRRRPRSLEFLRFLLLAVEFLNV